MLFKRLSFYLAVFGIVGGVLMVRKLRHVPDAPTPIQPPATSPFDNSVAATGIIEARGENVKIGAIKAGLVTDVFVEVNSAVKKGDPLLQISAREAKSKLKTAQSQLAVLKAMKEMESVQVRDWEDQLARVTQLEKQQVATQDELKRKQFALEAAKARLAKVDADLAALDAQVEQAQVDVDVLTVKAPRDGNILQLNIRAGEYANLNATDPLMILGNVNTLQVRADVDEQSAPMVEAEQPAEASIKGDTSNRMPLKFVRIEPFVVPKKSLTGDSAERVDTRVLQIIYEMEKGTNAPYVGQQVDVFIKRRARVETKTATR
ncbi:MAG: Secretion protein HlyD family protein [Verrucomicrobiales bacterium]|nr:Secretion protein HlyD family protein [Verrucomicrobiales bacterium]MDB6129376.1 Secretion protein HlyD family protein [Verrucomicrobiales bacterium]